MLFAQIAAPEAAAVAAETRPSVDQRTTRDASYDPRLEQLKMSERAREVNRGDKDYLPVRRPTEDEENARPEPGGTDYSAQAAIVEGYNDNVVQTQDRTNGPVTKHPSLFTGFDTSMTLRTWTSYTDAHEFRFQLRGQHYTPFDGYDQPDDGAVVGQYTGQIALAPRLTLMSVAIGTIASSNSSRLSDGPVFQVDPRNLQRTYSMSNVRSTLVYEATDRMRVNTSADVAVGTTIKDTPVLLSGNQVIDHKGVDYVAPGVEEQVFYDFTDQDTGNVRLRYEQNRNYFALDFTRNPPRYLGVTSTHIGEASTGFSHLITQELRSLTTVGATIASAPPLDVDSRPILSPLVTQELFLRNQNWLFEWMMGYNYGSANPRLGFGPSLIAGAAIEGTPFPRNEVLKRFAILGNAQASRAAFRTGTTDLSRVTFVGASLEARYAINNWLGLLGGYNVRYAAFEGSEQLPALFRNVFFLGVSGYWTTDRTLPVLQTFVAPTRPG